MSIARAFTLRRKDSKTSKTSSFPTFGRSASMKHSDKPVDIRKISSPVALLSTTNMLSYNAPDVSAVRAQRKASFSVSSGSSARSSADESDTSSTSRDTTLTDASSIGSSSSQTSSPNADRDTKSSFFTSPSKTSTTAPAIPPRLSRSSSTIELRQSHTSHASLTVPIGDSPQVPQRAPSHSKRAHEVLAKKRSLQSMPRSASISSIASSSRETKRSSIEFFSKDILDGPPSTLPNFSSIERLSVPAVASAPVTPQHHPFGKELTQLDEIAEEFGGAIRDAEREADTRFMRQNGLIRFCAQDYMEEIQPLFSNYFSPYATHQQVQEVAWI